MHVQYITSNLEYVFHHNPIYSGLCRITLFILNIILLFATLKRFNTTYTLHTVYFALLTYICTNPVFISIPHALHYNVFAVSIQYYTCSNLHCLSIISYLNILITHSPSHKQKVILLSKQRLRKSFSHARDEWHLNISNIWMSNNRCL